MAYIHDAPKDKLVTIKLPAVLPDTLRGACESFNRKKVRLFCKTHGDIQAVASVQDIKQFHESAEYRVTLACGCPRIISLAVARTPSGKAKLAEEQRRAR